MSKEFTRMVRPTASVEIGWRSGGRKTLLARTDRNGNHVLLKPLLVADSRVASGRQYIDETILGDHLKLNVGIGSKECGHDARQYHSRGTDRYIQPERACRTIPKAVDHIECRLDFP